MLLETLKDLLISVVFTCKFMRKNQYWLSLNLLPHVFQSYVSKIYTGIMLTYIRLYQFYHGKLLRVSNFSSHFKTVRS